MTDAFKCFFLETAELFNSEALSREIKPVSEFYVLFLERIVYNFRSLCGAERTALYGYPFDAFKMLRELFDSAVLTAAALQKITTFYALEGIDPNSSKTISLSSVKKSRIQAEHDAFSQMLGDKSDFSEDTINMLKKLNDHFDLEVHGARLSRVFGEGWLNGNPFSVTPKYEEWPFIFFINRFCEVSWLILRMMPNLQLSIPFFPEKWKEQWKILDSSFETMVFSITKEDENKKIGEVMVEFVKKKFCFNENSSFPL